MPFSLRVRDAVLMGLAYGGVSLLVVEAVAFGYPTGAVFWPGAGLTVGALIRLPRDRWPALLCGVFVAEVLVDLTIPVSLGVALIWACANTVEPLVGASLLRGTRPAVVLGSVTAVTRFVLWGAVVGPLAGATVGAAVSASAGVEPFWPTWPRWWVGDGIGVLLVAPAVFTLRRQDLAHAGQVERWSLLAALGVVTLVVVLPWGEGPWIQGLPFLLAPALVMVAMRLGPMTAAIALAASATTVNAVTALGVGPFAVSGTYSGLVVAQVCLAGGAFALLTVSALNYDLVTLQQVEEILRTQALHDTLTGVANRRLLDEQLAISLAGLRRGDGHLAVLLIDLDRFKQLNDAYGHSAGDAALVEVAARLRGTVRPTDTVARTGGDEFVVVLPGLPDLALAEEFRARISATLNKPLLWQASVLPLGASVGLATTDDPTTTVDEILAAADRSMYDVKSPDRPG